PTHLGVVPGAAGDHILASRSIKRVDPGSTGERVRGPTARQSVGSRAAGEVLDVGGDVVALARLPVVGNAVDRGGHRSRAGGVVGRVRSGPAVHDVGARTAFE